MNLRLLTLAMAGALFVKTTHAQLTTPEILARSIQPQCLNYCVVGVCLWLRCTNFGCSVETRLKVRHRRPDLVVSVMEHPGDNPWSEVQAAGIAAIAAGQLQMGFSSFGGGRHTPKAASGDDRHRNLRFADVEIWGHPLSVDNQWLSLMGLSVPGICPARTFPYQPYYLSALDAIPWRTGFTEVLYPQSYIPGLQEVGTFPIDTWGSVFPRMGFLGAQPDSRRAFATFAQRAAHFTTRSRQPHIYREAPGQSVTVSNARWQLLWPSPPVSFCGPFTALNAHLVLPNGLLQGAVGTDNTVWQLWREHSCCLPNPGAILLTDFDLAPICLPGALP